MQAPHAVGIGWCMSVLSPEVTFHKQQRIDYYCNQNNFVNPKLELCRKALVNISIDTALDAFVAYLNNCHSSIKFTVTKSTTSVDFLDLTVKKTTNGISTELFIKPTSSLAYLHRNSCHPRHVFTSLPYGEFLRVRRNCSDNASFDLYAARLKQAFCNRGYDPQEIQTALDKARTQDRTQLLSKGLPTDILPLVSEEETNDEA